MQILSLSLIAALALPGLLPDTGPAPESAQVERRHGLYLDPDGTVIGSRAYRVTLDEMDAFAAELLDGLQKPSFTENREYCGYIFTKRGKRLFATEPRRGRAASCVLPEMDADLTVLASYHTHAGDDLMADGEVPSDVDLESDMAEGNPGYVSTPGGRLWRTNPDRARVDLICAKGCVRRDARYLDCETRALQDSYTLQELYLRANSPDGICPNIER